MCWYCQVYRFQIMEKHIDSIKWKNALVLLTPILLKPTFRADGRLHHSIYPHIFPEEEEDNISSFMVKLKERLNFLFKDIMDAYESSVRG